jgi:alpha-tubulin suppressor-like RCC1 family protein
MPRNFHLTRARSPLAAAVVALLAGAVACADPAAPEQRQAASALLTPIYGGPTLYLPASPHVVGGSQHSCVLRRDWVALCWGDNRRGQLGYGGPLPGSATQWPAPMPVAGGILFKQLAAGADFNCGLDRDGRAYCWGDGTHGALGYGGYDPQFAPVAVLGGHTFNAIAAGRSHACALTTAGAAYCWGDNGYGQLGSNTGSTLSPVAVAGGNAFKAIAAGMDFTCALTTTGVAMCWGFGGTLGNGSAASSATPVYVAGGLTFTTIDAGARHTCATTSGGVGYCWGYNGDGQAGVPPGATTVSGWVLTPTRAGGSSNLFQYINAGGSHSCGIRKFTEAGADTTHNVLCWGADWAGQRGDGSSTSGVVESDSAGAVGFRTIGLGQDHSCGINKSGVAYCWGRGDRDQVGATPSQITINPLPRRVSGGHDFSP